MMKLFKTIDDKLFELGYYKLRDDSFTVIYERSVSGRLYGSDVHYHQKVSICSKGTGEGFIIESYKSSSCESVPLCAYEIKLLMRKAKQKHFKYKKNDSIWSARKILSQRQK